MIYHIACLHTGEIVARVEFMPVASLLVDAAVVIKEAAAGIEGSGAAFVVASHGGAKLGGLLAIGRVWVVDAAVSADVSRGILELTAADLARVTRILVVFLDLGLLSSHDDGLVDVWS